MDQTYVLALRRIYDAICLRELDENYVEAWRALEEATALNAAQKSSGSDRDERQSVIEAQRELIPTIVLTLDVDVAPVPALRLSFDDGPFPAHLGQPLGITPGRHTIEVSAEGFETFFREYDVRPGQRLNVAARLERLPPAPAERSGVTDAGKKVTDDGAQQRKWGYAAGSVGVGFLAIAGGLQVLAHGKWDDKDYKQAEIIERTAIVAGVVGGLALAGGAWLVIDAWPPSSPSSAETSARVTLRLTGTGLQGSVHW